MSGMTRTSTNPSSLASARRYARKLQAVEAARQTRPSDGRRCPVCGSAPGSGFNTYCGTDHMLRGASDA